MRGIMLASVYDNIDCVFLERSRPGITLDIPIGGCCAHANLESLKKVPPRSRRPPRCSLMSEQFTRTTALLTTPSHFSKRCPPALCLMDSARRRVGAWSIGQRECFGVCRTNRPSTARATRLRTASSSSLMHFSRTVIISAFLCFPTTRCRVA